MEKFILGCDWGTSSFRLRLLDVHEQKVLGELLTTEGVSTIHNAWQNSISENSGISRTEAFKKHLKKQLGILSKKVLIGLQNIPIVISGMASSSIGMEDIPYAKVPFALDGSEAITKRLENEKDFPHDIILISGVRSEKDVMRGEETQLVGLLELLHQSGNKPKEGIFIFPGTHSKHINIRHNQLIDFRTFMTGELYNVMSQNSILKASVEIGETIFDPTNSNAFNLGVDESQSSNILNGLFTVRTNQVFKKLNKQQNGFYLSGLLIGAELSYLVKRVERPLVLCSGSNLFEYYKHAIKALGLLDRTTLVPIELGDKAALAGQQLIFKNLVETSVQQ